MTLTASILIIFFTVRRIMRDTTDDAAAGIDLKGQGR